MKSLYNIQQEYLELIDEIQEADGELTEETLERLTVHETNAEQKLVIYKNIIGELTAHSALADAEIERIKAFKQSKERAIDRLKGSMLQALLMFGAEDAKGIKRLEYGTLRLSTRKSKFVDIQEEDTISKDYLKIDVSNLNSEQYLKLIELFPTLKDSSKKKIAKTDIKKAIEEGKTVEGASLETRYSLTIK